MILKQKKKIEAERSMERDKRKITFKKTLPEIICMIIVAAGIYVVSYLKQKTFDVTLSHMVMVVLGVAITGFMFRKQYLNEALSYDNNDHFFRFWLCFMIGILMAFVCIFLPVSGWPFLALFVMLSLFSSTGTGILSAAMLLMLTVLGSGASVTIYFLYFVSGIFAIVLFGGLENEFKIGIPTFLSMLCLLMCLTANVVLTANAHLDFELFVIPVANIIISCVLLIGMLNLFSALVIYKYRGKYLELNDSENVLLAEYKEKSRADFFQCIHTAYFCERIGKALSLNVDALKCAGYYHRWGTEIQKLMEEHEFPPSAALILREYTDKHYMHKETAVLVCSDAIVSTVIYMFSKSKEKILDYDQIIDAVFKRFTDKHTFRQCDITMRELDTICKIFKEEKLYYDFLR